MVVSFYFSTGKSVAVPLNMRIAIMKVDTMFLKIDCVRFQGYSVSLLILIVQI